MSLALLETSETNPEVQDSKYLELKRSLEMSREKNKDYMKRGRNLLVAFTSKLQEKDRQLSQLRELHSEELAIISQQLLALQVTLTKEQSRLNKIIAEKDANLAQKVLEIEQLNSKFALSRSSRVSKIQRPSSLNRKSVPKEISSDDSSTSPMSTPGESRPSLRMCLSLNSAQDSKANNTNDENCDELNPQKRGILKSSSSYDLRNQKSILANLQKLISSDNDLNVKKAFTDTGKGDKSDSGRESDELGSPMSQQKQLINHSRTESADSSFDGSEEISLDPVSVSSGGQQKVCRLSIRSNGKKKPCPPPRSSTTKLTTTPNPNAPMSKPKLERRTVVSIRPDRDPNNNSSQDIKKRVTFNEEDKRNLIEQRAIKLLENSIMNYKPNDISKALADSSPQKSLHHRGDLSYIEYF